MYNSLKTALFSDFLDPCDDMVHYRIGKEHIHVLDDVFVKKKSRSTKSCRNPELIKIIV